MAVLTSEQGKRTSRSLATTVLAVAGTIALLYFGRTLLITVTISAMLALLLDPFVRLTMRTRLPRPVASLLVCATAGLLLYLLGLGIWLQLQSLAADLPAYSARLGVLVETASARITEAEQRLASVFPVRPRTEPPPAQPTPSRARRGARTPVPDPVAPPAVQEVRLKQEPPPPLQLVFDAVRSVSGTLLMVSFVPFLVYFMLSWQDHIRQGTQMLFQGGAGQAFGKSWSGVAQITRVYVIGNFQLGCLLALASAAVFWYFDLPYALLAGVVSGFVSLLPYVGLPLAIVPPLFAALPVYADVSTYVELAAIVGVFHLVALNLLYPKIVGASLHLNPLAVTLALMFWVEVWGPLGLILAIPITAGIKAVCDNIEGWRPFGKLLGD